MSKCISGCLSERTKILLADGSEREISSLRPGDIVKLSNGSSSVVMNMWKGFEETLIKITTGSGRSIQMTEIHPVLANNDWIKAKDLKIDDILSTIGDDTPYFCKIIKIEHIEYKDFVYNLDFENDNSSFYANGIVVGDFNMQNSML